MEQDEPKPKYSRLIAGKKVEQDTIGELLKAGKKVIYFCDCNEDGKKEYEELEKEYKGFIDNKDLLLYRWKGEKEINLIDGIDAENHYA